MDRRLMITVVICAVVIIAALITCIPRVYGDDEIPLVVTMPVDTEIAGYSAVLHNAGWTDMFRLVGVKEIVGSDIVCPLVFLSQERNRLETEGLTARLRRTSWNGLQVVEIPAPRLKTLPVLTGDDIILFPVSAQTVARHFASVLTSKVEPGEKRLSDGTTVPDYRLRQLVGESEWTVSANRVVCPRITYTLTSTAPKISIEVEVVGMKVGSLWKCWVWSMKTDFVT